MGLLFKKHSCIKLIDKLRNYFSRSEYRIVFDGRVKLDELEPRLLMAADIVISEFMADNGTTIDDEDGDSSDWLELSNVGDEAADLSGMYLTDDADLLTRWTLPSVTLNPGEQLLIFASGKDRNDPLNELHTNFQLNSGGEYLALVDTDGTTVLSDYHPEYPNQKLDVSYGLGQSITTTTLIDSSGSVNYFVPSDSILPTDWTSITFDDTAWNTGAGTLGFDNSPGDAFIPLGGYWPLNEGVGGNGDTVGDATGSNPGVIEGFGISGSAWIEDTPTTGFENPYSLDFDGINDFVQTPYPGIGGNSPRTVSLWVKTTATNLHGLLGYGADVADQKWHMRLNSNAGNGLVGRFRVEVNGGFIIGSTNIADNQWHQLTVVIPNGATDITNGLLYVDGQLETLSGSATQPINTGLGVNNVTIGNSVTGNGSQQYVDASIDDVRFYNRDLSAAEVDALSSTPTTNGLVAHWNFDEGSGLIAGEAISGNDGTLTNMTPGILAGWVNDTPPLINETNAIQFNGIDTAIKTTYEGVGGDGDRSVSFWMNSTDISDHGIFAYGDSLSDGGKFHIRLNSAAVDGNVGAIRTETQNGRIIGSTNIADGQWHHISVVFENDGTPDNEDVRMYVDGVLETISGVTPITLNTNISPDVADPVWIGKRNQGGVIRAFDGKLSDVAMYEGVLTQEQITALATGASRPDTISSYVGLIDTNIETDLFNMNASILTRYHFTVDAGVNYEQLFLDMRYDDGFIAYINGVEVASRNAPVTPSGTSAATGEHAGGTLETINITSFNNILVEGDNILAIHGLNQAADDGDFLLQTSLRGVDIESGIAGYFQVATPGTPNGNTFAGFVNDTSFNFNRGFYDAPIDLEITSTTIDAVIYYTTDGSAPSPTNGTEYTDPININSTTVIRAAAYADNLIPTNIDTQTYVFTADVKNQPISPAGFPTIWGSRTPNYEMDPEVVNDPLYTNLIENSLMSLPVISVVADNDTFFSAASGIIANSTQRGDAWEREVSLEFFNFEHGEQLQTDAGMRMTGRASRSANREGKHNMRVAFRSSYGDPRLNFPLFEDTYIEDFDSIMFRGGNGDSYVNPAVFNRAQYIRDQWHREAMRDMGHLQPHQTYVHMYVNGLYWGMYHIFERSDADMLANYLGGNEEDYDIVKDGGTNGVLEAQDGTLNAWNAMLAIATGGPMDDARFDLLEEQIDMENLADYMLTNFVSGNNDWDSSNWRAGRNRNGGKWIFFAHDSERTDINANGVASGSYGVVDRDVTGVNNNNFPSRVHQLLSANAKYQRLFANRMQLHMFNGGALTPQANMDRWNELADTIRPAIIAESARWGDTHSAVPRTLDNQFEPMLTRMMNDFFPGRTELVVNQLNARGLYPSVGAPAFEVNNFPQHGGDISLTDAISLVSTAGPSFDQTVTLISENANAYTHIPTTNVLGTTWTSPSFDPENAGWINGNLGVGYENTTGYETFIQTNIGTEIFNVSTSAFVSVEFNHDDSITFESLNLNMRYDDAFIAYLNGTEVTRTTNITNDIPGTADVTTGHEANASFETFNITAFENLLVDGPNVLAIHGINAAISSTDFLMQPQLVGAYTSENPISDPIYYTTDGSNVLLDDGTRNPDAILYENPFMLTASAQVNAVQYDGINYSAQTSALFTVDIPLRVSELHYNHDGDDAAEFVELMNVGNTTIDLTGIQFVRDDLLDGFEYEFLETDNNLLLPPGQRIVIPRNLTTFSALHPSVPAELIADREYTGSLSNGGEVLTLVDSVGGIIQQFRYEDGDSDNETEWTNLPDGNGPSLDLINPIADKSTWSIGSSWRASSLDNGTPGRPDPIGIALEGDFNYDGIVNIADLAKLASNFNKDSNIDPFPDIRWQHGDSNGDGVVNIQDLAKLASNFGKTGSNGFPQPPAAGAAAALTSTPNDNSLNHEAILLNDLQFEHSEHSENWNHIGNLLDEDESILQLI